MVYPWSDAHCPDGEFAGGSDIMIPDTGTFSIPAHEFAYETRGGTPCTLTITLYRARSGTGAPGLQIEGRQQREVTIGVNGASIDMGLSADGGVFDASKD
jgi:hypothetical protein